MALLHKDDLIYRYLWTASKGDDPHLTGKPDSSLLNRREGYEVLPFINGFAETHGLRKKQAALKVEWMIQEHLPDDVRSHANVRHWLIQSWDAHEKEWAHKVARGDVPQN